MPAVVIRQRKAWRRRDGVFLYFEVRFDFSPHELLSDLDVILQ
jgi:hypothetical protein